MKTEYKYSLMRSWKRQTEEAVMQLLAEYGVQYREGAVYDHRFEQILPAACGKQTDRIDSV